MVSTRSRVRPISPPPEGDVLELPAGGAVTLELAHNRGQTSFSFGGIYTSEWPDGMQHPEDWQNVEDPGGCIDTDGAMHTQNQTMAAGTALAISYHPTLGDVKIDDLVVFSVLPK